MELFVPRLSTTVHAPDTSHHAGANQIKLLEVTPDKKLVWSHTDDKKFGIHHFQILDTNGKAIDLPLR